MAAAIFTAVPAQGQGPPKGALESLLHNQSTNLVDKVCALIVRDNLIKWRNSGILLDLNLPEVGVELAPGHHYFMYITEEPRFWR